MIIILKSTKSHVLQDYLPTAFEEVEFSASMIKYTIFLRFYVVQIFRRVLDMLYCEHKYCKMYTSPKYFAAICYVDHIQIRNE